MEVGVLTGLGEAVEALDCRIQIGLEIGGEPDTPGLGLVAREPFVNGLAQRAQGLALDHVGIVHTRRHDEAAVFVARAVILAPLIPDRDQYQIGILPGRRVPFEKFLRHLVVGELLVGDPTALLAHIDHRIAGGGEGADQRGIAGNRLLKDDGAHPGIIHVPQLRAERPAMVMKSPSLV